MQRGGKKEFVAVHGPDNKTVLLDPQRCQFYIVGTAPVFSLCILLNRGLFKGIRDHRKKRVCSAHAPAHHLTRQRKCQDHRRARILGRLHRNLARQQGCCRVW